MQGLLVRENLGCRTWPSICVIIINVTIVSNNFVCEETQLSINSVKKHKLVVDDTQVSGGENHEEDGLKKTYS